MDSTGMMNWDEYKNKAEAVASSVAASGLLCGDEVDDSEINVCLLIPESCVALLIGKAGANINTTKAVSGANVSFQKKDDSVRGYRKCFHSGPLSSVTRAMAVNLAFVQETTGGDSSATIVVNHDAAGGVIGKGGENLKSVREQTKCKVAMEKSQEAMPAYGGRCLTLEHESQAMVMQAIYFCVRCKGFSSPSARDDQAPQPDFGGYGPASSRGKAARCAPYFAGPSRDVCAIHLKKRGKQNLRPSPTMPGQFVCMENDQCKGVTNPQAMGAQGMGGQQGYMLGQQGMGGMGGGMGMSGQQGMGGMGMGGMGGMGLGGGGMDMFGGMYGMNAPMGGNVCSTHGKRRGARNLQPHPTQSGMFVCMAEDQCK